jgi:hypothetical protein
MKLKESAAKYKMTTVDRICLNWFLQIALQHFVGRGEDGVKP